MSKEKTKAKMVGSSMNKLCFHRRLASLDVGHVALHFVTICWSSLMAGGGAPLQIKIYDNDNSYVISGSVSVNT